MENVKVRKYYNHCPSVNSLALPLVVVCEPNTIFPGPPCIVDVQIPFLTFPVVPE